MRTIIWFIYFWAYLILLIPKMHKAAKFKSQGEEEKCEAIVQKDVYNWAKSLLKLAGVKATVIGAENLPDKDEACLYVANHQGNFDIPLMLTSLGKIPSLVAKIELSKLPLLRNWMCTLDCVFMDRNNIRQSAAAIKQANELLKEDKCSVVVFPEGTRSKSDTVGEFKNGAFKILSGTGAKLVPIAISGSYKVMEANGFWIKPAEVTVQILPPIPTENLSKQELKLLPDKVKELIVKAKQAVEK